MGDIVPRRRRKVNPTPPLVIGCDPSSSKLAFYIVPPVDGAACIPIARMLRKKGEYTPFSAGAAKDVCMEVLDIARPHATNTSRFYLFIEEPVVAKGGVRSSVVQAYINGVVQGEFVKAGFNVQVINIATWKASLGIPSKGGKPQVKASMELLYPNDVAACGSDGDLIDAAALARFGCQAFR